MIDIHCHLLYNIDDGSRSLEESIKALSQLKEFGYNAVILTPHYIRDSKYSSNRKNNLEILNTLKEELKAHKIEINFFLGNEIYIDDDIMDLLDRDEISSLNNTEYLLIELPMSGEYEGYIDIFNYLINNDKKIILAHPERYLSFQKDWNKIIELEEMGVLFQSNIESIIGRYGKGAKKLVKKLFKNHKISYLATDLHHAKKNIDDFIEAKKKILKYMTMEEFNKLTYQNPQKLICMDEKET